MKRIGTVVWAGVQFVKLAARVVVVPGFRDFYVLSAQSLDELIAGLGAVAADHDLDVLRFNRDVVKSLEGLAADPKWNPEVGKIKEKAAFPFDGTCTCGWPRLSDGSCLNGECPDESLAEEEDA